jgi:AraC-like DNA-binding protein
MVILDRRIAILDLMASPSDSRKRRTDALPAFVSRQIVTSHRYFLDLRPIASRPLTVVCGGEELVRRDYRVEREEFPYFCIEFVAAGEGSAVLAGCAVPLGPGSVFSYAPGVPHTIQTDPRRRLRKFYIDFIGSEALKRLRAARLSPGSHLTVAPPGEIQAVFDLIQRCGLSPSLHSQSLCGQLLGVLLTKITERALPTAPGDVAARHTFERFKKFLTDERQRLLSIEMAAAEFGISTAYACRLFRRFGEQSPYRYLLRQRMSLAADLLTHERLQVRQAAARLGFADPYQFSRAFKRVAGVSPRDFRNSP